jgi:hypothetical protein
MAEAKIISVPGNGQVCIGKKYAGRAARVEYISENKIVVTFGQFIPDDQATFFTGEAKKKLEEFGEYEKSAPKEGSVEKLKANSRGKK